jgi:hypothetical protein
MRGGKGYRKPSERDGLKNAIIHGTSTAPLWIKFIDIAHRMGLQPWKLIGGSRLLWFVRFEAMREYEAKAAQRERNKPASLESVDARQRKHR